MLFLNAQETILAWQCIFFAFNIPPSRSAKNIFRNCLMGVPRSTKKLVLSRPMLYVGQFRDVEMIKFFITKEKSNPMQVIFISTSQLHTLCLMLLQEEQDTVRSDAILLKFVAKGLFYRFGWSSTYRFQNLCDSSQLLILVIIFTEQLGICLITFFFFHLQVYNTLVVCLQAEA